MLTPRFSVSQNDEFVFVTIQLSAMRFSAQNVEMVINDTLFIFALPPYYLRLRFPGSLIEDERATSRFVPKEECIKIQLPKKTKGQEFPDLDLTAKLLARLNEPTATSEVKKGPLIEEMDDSADLHNIASEAVQFDWEMKQTPQPDLQTGIHMEKPKYGFNNQYSDMLSATLSNGNDINELSDPDELKPDDRIMQRLIKENLKFDPEYYANEYLTAKYLSDECNIKNILKWESPYKKMFQKSQTVEFSQREQDLMADLPKRAYIIDDPRPTYYTIVCLLYAYCYEIRSNEGDSNVESGWTIGKLTPQISCLDSQLLQSSNETETSVLRVVVLTMERRALSYPLVRNFDLAQQCWDDVNSVLRCGKRGVLKAVLAAREFFRFHDIYYIYCKVLLDDLCNWILRDDGCNDTVLRNLAHALKKEAQSVQKKDLVFEKIMTEGSEEMEFVNINDIEELAEESYRNQEK